MAPIFYCNRNGIYNENCGQPSHTLIHIAMYSRLWTLAGSVTVSPLSGVLTVVCWRSRWRGTVRMVRRCHSFIIRWTLGNTEEWPAAVCTECHGAQHHHHAPSDSPLLPDRGGAAGIYGSIPGQAPGSRPGLGAACHLPVPTIPDWAHHGGEEAESGDR